MPIQPLFPLRTRPARFLGVVLLAAVLGLFGAPSAAQQAVAEAQALFQAGEWEKAAGVLEAALEQDPEDAQSWQMLAVARRNLGDLDGALEAYQKAVDHGLRNVQVLAGLAITHGQAGNPGPAFEALREAVAAGLPVGVLDNHPGLASLRSDPRFAELRTQAEVLTYPCEHDEKYHQLDFWVGEWKAMTQGQQVGVNRITRQQRGCIIHESWTPTGGVGGGSSINYYDPSTGTWNQNWVSEVGGVVRYSGKFEDGAMRMEGVNIQANGQVRKARVTLTPKEGGLHHRIEHSTDGGETWFVVFDANYEPLGEAGSGD